MVSNLVMDDLFEFVRLSLREKRIGRPLFFKKYVDDTIAAVHKNDLGKLLSLLNSFDSRIQFTEERESDGAIPFLDLKLIHCGDRICTN